MINLNSNNFVTKIATGLWLVDFWAVWCGPCQIQGQVLEEAAPDLEQKGLKIGKINVDEESQIAQKYGIMSIPTLILFRDGVEAKRLIGFQNKKKISQEINEFLI